MFAPKNMTILLVISSLVFYAGVLSAGWSVCLDDACRWSIALPADILQTFSFITGVFSVSMLAWGILFRGMISMPGLGAEQTEEELIFTTNELIEMDRAEEQNHNEHARQLAMISWEGGYSANPTYYDYQGRQIDAFENRYTGYVNPMEDKRHIINGRPNKQVYKMRPVPGDAWKIEYL